MIICRLTLTDRVEGTEITSRVEVDDLEEHLRQQRLRWFGHVVRRNEEVDKESVGAENKKKKNEMHASQVMNLLYVVKKEMRMRGVCTTGCRR